MRALIGAAGLTSSCCGSEEVIETRMPAPDALHEGTWLQWPHHYTYGRIFRDDVDPQWVEMTRALVTGENVHIIAYDQTEKDRITALLTTAGVSLERVDFTLSRTDDFWVRDNGPIFVFDKNNDLKLIDWGFDGWGDDAPYTNDDVVPSAVARATNLPLVDSNAMVLEGGAVELDGKGVLMATRSAILEPNRNPGLTQPQAESFLRRNLGAEKFIWLEGRDGGREDITDTHIDGFAVFASDRKIATMKRADLTYWGLSQADIDRLYMATDIDDEPYEFVYLPLTQSNVVTSYGRNLGFKGSYVNYYVANTVVLMPSYNDANDILAQEILEELYPSKVVVPVDCRNLYANGGMVHCVTQQQPAIITVESGDMLLNIKNIREAEVGMEFQGISGLSYRLESCATLEDDDWEGVENFFLKNDVRDISYSMESESSLFFRVVKP